MSRPPIPAARGSLQTLALVAVLGVGSLPVGAQTTESEFERLLRGYSELTTLAGLGEGDEKDNYWEVDFEGAPATEIELSNPHMTMADAAGNYYIADKESNSVLKVDSAGIVTTFAGTHEEGFNGEAGDATEIQLDHPNGLFVRPDGIVYVLDYLNKRVRRVDKLGQMVTILHDPEGFGIGRALWVSEDERTIFYNGPSRVMKWTWGIGSKVYTDGLSSPGNLTVDPNGDLVVTDRGASLVYRVEEDGTKTVIAGNGSDDEPENGRPATEIGLEDVRGIAFRPDGSYFVCTHKGGDVVFVDTNGIANIFIAGRGNKNVHAGDGEPPESPSDKISEPRGIALAPNGDLIITTNDSGFIRIVKAIPPPRLGSITPAGENILEVSWERIPQHGVYVESSTDLREWRALTFLPKGTSSYLTQPDSSDRYFRLRPRRE